MRFFTADLHLGHANIIRYCDRPFPTVGAMNGALIANWIEIVRPDDDVWVLGDVAMGRISETLPLVANLPGRKHLVPGNHDRCWPGHRQVRPEHVAMYEDVGFTIHPPILRTELGDHDVVLCHLPIAGDSRDADRYTEHRPTLDADTWLLHGHVHEKWKTNGCQINVGVDVWNYRPVPETDLIELMTTRAQTPAVTPRQASPDDAR
jgi:calcineurin-like phosphoesterase family protein